MSMILLDRCDSELKCLEIRGKTDEGCKVIAFGVVIFVD